jgi:hypothetical protein
MKFAIFFAAAFVLYSQQQPVQQDPEKARLEGQVLNSANGEPLRKTRLTLPFYTNVHTDAAGHFIISGITPGSYKVYAWDQVNTNAVMYDPDFLRPYEGAGTMVEIQSNGKHPADLRLIINKEPDDRSR